MHRAGYYSHVYLLRHFYKAKKMAKYKIIDIKLLFFHFLGSKVLSYE